MRAKASPFGLGRGRRCEVVAELDLGAQPAGARPVDRAVDHDPVQPRAERAAAVEAVEVANGGEERLLGDVLGGGGVAGDEPRRAERARPVLAKEPLEVVDRAPLGTPDPGALRHPSTLRRAFLMRSIRRVDLCGSMMRIAAHEASAARPRRRDARCCSREPRAPPPARRSTAPRASSPFAGRHADRLPRLGGSAPYRSSTCAPASRCSPLPGRARRRPRRSSTRSRQSFEWYDATTGASTRPRTRCRGRFGSSALRRTARGRSASVSERRDDSRRLGRAASRLVALARQATGTSTRCAATTCT